MRSVCSAIAVAVVLAWPMPLRAAPAGLDPVPNNAQTAVVSAYLHALHDARYAAAFRLLNANARAYYRDAENFRSIFVADAYAITAWRLLGTRGGQTPGRVFFVRETARFRDHARDALLEVTATVPVGVVSEHDGWRIKDPGHPWRAFATNAAAQLNGVEVRVKKVSYFARRIETVVTLTNHGSSFVTILAYGKSILHDAAGHPYRLIETRDWSLTDKVLFEGLRLPPDARYTGTLAFASDPLDNAPRTFALTLAPLLADGTDAPFEVDVDAIAPEPGAPVSR
ncbi:MAG: hypothetical protein ABSB70_13810 [Candidatus Velthaea sp.]